MKNFLLASLFLGLTVYLSFELYQRVQDQQLQDQPAKDVEDRALSAKDHSFTTPKKSDGLSLPDEIQIVRQDGTRLDVRLTARNDTHIRFERLSDGQVFTFEIDKLDKNSKKRVLAYRSSGLSEKRTLEDVYIEQLHVAIARINEKLSVLRAQFAASDSKVEKRTLNGEIRELLAELKIAETKLAERTD
jgi:hypothetical protein